jgi:hypothetical protein
MMVVVDAFLSYPRLVRFWRRRYIFDVGLKAAAELRRAVAARVDDTKREAESREQFEEEEEACIVVYY